MKKMIYLLGFWMLSGSSTLFSQAIIGGTAAPDGVYPWMAVLADPAKSELTEAHLCGGTLIDEEWVLTAAHCITDARSLGINELEVALNVTDLSNPNSGYERIQVKATHLHPGFGLIGNRNFDIALLQLENPSQQLPLALPAQGDQSFYTPGTPGLVLGWGLADTFTYESSAVLQQAAIEVIDPTDCNAPTSYDGEVTLDMFCAGTLMGQPLAGSATGDSGGPMVVDQAGQWLQIGIVSWGRELWSTAQFPGVFQKTAIHREWIEMVMNDNTVSIGEEPTLTSRMTVYQNDAQLQIEIDGNEGENVKIYLADAYGRILLQTTQRSIANTRYELNWGAFPAGAYVLGINVDQQFGSRLLIKPR